MRFHYAEGNVCGEPFPLLQLSCGKMINSGKREKFLVGMMFVDVRKRAIPKKLDCPSQIGGLAC